MMLVCDSETVIYRGYQSSILLVYLSDL